MGGGTYRPEADSRHLFWWKGSILSTRPRQVAFAIEEPRAREGGCTGKARAALFQRVLDYGACFVDTTVTADATHHSRTGSLHGTTGWACSILDDGPCASAPANGVDGLPPGASALTMPRRPAKQPLVEHPRTTHRRPSRSDLRLSLEVSTHVQGTKDGTAVVALVPLKVSREDRVLDF